MKAEDLSTKTPDELNATLLDLKKKQFNLRFQLSQGGLSNTGEIRTVRRAIARVHTFLKPTAAKVAAPKKAKAAKAPAADKPVKKAAAKKAAE